MTADDYVVDDTHMDDFLKEHEDVTFLTPDNSKKSQEYVITRVITAFETNPTNFLLR